MKTYHFNKQKYQNGISMELGKIEDIPQFNFTSEVHNASFYEILMFWQVDGHIMLGPKRVNLKRNLFLFISPYQKRRWFVEEKNVRGYFLIFEKDFLNEFFSDKHFVHRLQYFYNHSVSPYYVADRRIFSFEHDIFQEIADEVNNVKTDSAHLLRSLLYYILIKLNREFCTFHELNEKTHANETAVKFKDLLQTNIRTCQKVNDYCQLLNISRVALNTSVKKQYGITAKEMIDRQLLAEIKDHILFSDKTIAEVSFLLNFSEPQHLNRFFKRLTRQTPAEFRAVYQNGNISF